MLKVLSSVRFAVAVFIVVAVVSATATFLNRPEMFRGVFFLLPAALFALSLLSCTVDSLVRRPRRRLTGYSHDVIHVGVLILIAGGALTLLGAREDEVILQVGESVVIAGEWEVQLLDSVRSAENWESVLSVRKNGETVRTETVSVNNPVTIGGVRLLQQSWAKERALILEDSGGNRHFMVPGEGFVSGAIALVLEERQDAPLGLQFVRYSEEMRTGEVFVETGMIVAGLTVVDTELRVRSGLQAVRDPGAPVAMAGAIILVTGMLLFMTKKIREEKKRDG